MKKIPKKYFKAANLHHMLLSLRRLFASGYTVEQIAKQINELYSKAPDYDRAAMGWLLTALYDFEDRHIATKCAELFGVFSDNGLDPERTVSYQVVADYFKSDPLLFLDRFNDDVYEKFKGNEKFDGESYWMVVPPEETENVINMTNNIYCVLEPSLTVNFLSITDSSEDILVDEDVYEEKEPLYFTEHSYFISPVYKLKVIKKIFEYCLERIGFPNVNINLTALFPCRKSKLTNREDFDKDGQYAKDWEGVEICEYKEIAKRKNFMFRSCDPELRIPHLKDYIQIQLKRTLVLSIYATALIFEEMSKHNLTQHSHINLTRWAKKLKIFGPKEPF